MNRLALELVADANPLLKALDNVQRNLDRFTASAESAGQAIGGGLGKALDNFQNFAKGGASAAGILAGGFVAAASAAVALTASAGRQVEQLDQLSQKTGISMKTLQGWSVIMAENDLQAESLTTAMRTLSKNMVEAKDPASNAAKAFEAAGISVKDFGSTESVIRAISDRFKDMPDGPEKARIAIEFLGKSGLDLIPVLNRGSKALDESEAAAKRFGAQLNVIQQKTLKDADDALDRVGVAADSLKKNLASIFAPVVQRGAELLAEAMGTLAKWAREASTAFSTLYIRLQHIGMAIEEMGSVLFSKEVFNSGAWKQALDNISLIDKEAAKLIAKRRELAEVDTEPVLQVPEVHVTATKITGQDQSAHMVDFRAMQHAEEALGHVTVQMTQTKIAAMRADESRRGRAQQSIRTDGHGRGSRSFVE